MALTDKELQEFIDSLSTEELEQLQTQLKAKESSESSSDSPRVQPQAGKSKLSCCPYCKSTHYKKHGCTSSGMQRYICKDCRKTFSENHGDSLRYTHLSSEQWKTVIRGIVYDHSLPVIAADAHISVSTAWLCRIKVNQAIATMYGYSDLFKGLAEADEYYYRASFKGKRSPEFFIYILHRMPRHHRNYAQRVQYLQQAGLYDRLQKEDPDFLEYLLSGESEKVKRGISNEQICILTLIDTTGELYIEPVAVGRLEKAMAKSKLKPRFIPDRSNILVTDDHNAYNRVLYGTKARHEVVPAGQHAAGKYNLAKVNGLHSGMDSYLDRYKGRAFSIKYLDLNLMLFWWLQKYKDYPVEEKVQALYNIMNDEIPDLDTRERVNQVTMAELQSREISLDTKGKFPTRL